MSKLTVESLREAKRILDEAAVTPPVGMILGQSVVDHLVRTHGFPRSRFRLRADGLYEINR